MSPDVAQRQRFVRGGGVALGLEKIGSISHRHPGLRRDGE
jgi:hypothetical protein